MKSEWKEYKLGELVELSQGQVINAQTNHLVVKEGIPLLRITDMLNGTQTIFIDEDKVSKKNIARSEDIIYTRTGQIGLVFTNQYGVVHNNSFKVIPKDKRLDRKYLFWFLKTKSVYDYVNRIAAGSAQPDLPHGSFKSISINLPPLPIQQRIASVLDAYDELIEVNKQRIKLLEENARELYKEWFVRMRFPGYKETKFVKGVPEGWELKKVGDTFKILGGGTPSTERSEYWNGYVNWFTPTDITDAKGMFLTESSNKITKKGLEESSATLFPAYSIMMTSRATIGAVGINTATSCTNQGFITCIPNENVPYTFLYFWILFNKNVFEMLGTGSTFLEITKGTFKKVNILLPDKNLLKKYHDWAEPIFNLIENMQHQNTHLRQIRDRLLPRLISGKLRLKDDQAPISVAADQL